METNFSTISKQVGWDTGKLLIPKVEVVKILYTEVEKGDVDALYNILRFHRFCESPRTPEEVESINFIFSAVQIGKELFQ